MRNRALRDWWIIAGCAALVCVAIVCSAASVYLLASLLLR